jgi:putative Holliday junction resolvase
VDYGEARTGIAVCDETETIASPVTTITGGYIPKLADNVLQLVKKHNAKMVIVGYPLNMDGSAGASAKKCADLANLLERELQIPVKLWDERLSTVQAHKSFNHMNIRGKKRKENIDKLAAVIILEEYLAYRKNKEGSGENKDEQ